MRSNRLQLNAAKTEVLWRASGRRQGQLPDASLTVGSDAVKPVRCVRDLGIYLDVSMRTHVSKTVASCFASLRHISKQTSTAVTGHVTNSVKAWLWQCHTSGDPCTSDRSTPVNTPHCSMSGEWLAQVWPRLFIGCESQSASCIDWPYLFFFAVITLRLSTWRWTYTGLQTTLGDDWDRQQHTNWWYLGWGSAPSASLGDRAFGIAGARVWNDLRCQRHSILSVFSSPLAAVVAYILAVHRERTWRP